MPITYSTSVSDVCEVNAPAESLGPDGFSATVELKCAWSDRITVANDILFTVQAYPRLPLLGAYARSVGIAPFPNSKLTKDGQGAAFEDALLTVNYAPLEANSEGGDPETFTVLSDRIEPNSEFMTQDYTDFRWGDNAGDLLKPEESPGKLVRGFDYVQSIGNLPSVHADTIALVDTVNSGSHVSAILGLTFAAETLLYSDPQISRTFLSDGSIVYNVEKRFSFRKNGWNKFWRAKTNDWEELFIAGGAAHKNFDVEDFSNILR